VRLSAARREQLVDAIFGAAVVALTVVLTIAALWLVVATVVGSVTLGRWIAGVVG
jgi:hypothetical protein